MTMATTASSAQSKNTKLDFLNTVAAILFKVKASSRTGSGAPPLEGASDCPQKCDRRKGWRECLVMEGGGEFAL